MKRKFLTIIMCSIILVQSSALDVHASMESGLLNDATQQNEDWVTEEEEKITRQKIEMAQVYMKYKYGKISEEEYLETCDKIGPNENRANMKKIRENRDVESNLILSEEIINKLENTGGEKANYSTRASSGMIQALKQEPQINGYYCGPAVANMIVKAKTSKNWGQNQFATALGTTKAEGTPFRKNGSYPMRNVLNNYTSSSFYAAWHNSGANANDLTYIANMISTIDSGYSIAANINTPKNSGKKLPAHPNRDIVHWLAIDGYSDNGHITHYADSAYNAPSIDWGLKAPYYNVSSSGMRKAINDRGMIF